MPDTGRFAPAPSAPLHLGNLRTALLAWLAAHASGASMRLRIDDLDAERSRSEIAAGQLRDLELLGLTHDGPVARQSDTLDAYAEAFGALRDGGHLYPCFCTRAEIREAVRAPHGSPTGTDHYPGTCRGLSRAESAARERAGRRPAWRLNAGGAVHEVNDLILGAHTLTCDDVVVRRSDGMFGYQLAVVVDDFRQGVGVVTRGSDLLQSSAPQRQLQDLLGLPRVRYAHVPLMLGPDGERLAKRHGAATLDDALRGCAALDLPGLAPDKPATPAAIRSALAATVGLAEPGENPTLRTLTARFRYDAVPVESTIMGRCSL